MKKLTGALIALLSFTIILTSCGPIPITPMTEQDRVSDMQWIFGIYEQNYAPLKYKESLFGFDNEALKAKYLEAAKKEQTNDEFFRLMHSFVAEFKDAHNSGSLIALNEKGSSSVAYMGFDGRRKGDYFVITKLLPTYQYSLDGVDFREGDIITKMNGKSLKEVVDELITPVRNLGNAESNYTYLMRNLFFRSSLIHPMPGLYDVETLSIKRGSKEFDIKVAWVTEDRFDFQNNMRAAIAQASNNAQTFVFGDNIQDMNGNLKLRRMNNDYLLQTIVKHAKMYNGAEEFFTDVFGMSFPKELKYSFGESFEMLGNNSDLNWHVVDSKRNAQGGFVYQEKPVLVKDANTGKESFEQVLAPEFSFESYQRLKEARVIPDNAEMVLIGPKSSPRYPIYPAYIVEQVVTVSTVFGKEDSVETEKVGYIFIDSFSVPADSQAVVNEFQDTLEVFEKEGVKSIVLDTINNGGGSLLLGVAMAQALTKKEVELPKIQLRLSDSWLSTFKQEASNPGYNSTVLNDKKRELAKIEEDVKAGKWLSRSFPLESLTGFNLKVNERKKLSSDVEIVVLVNEMCASMCDIFSAMLQDNEMATIMGTNSMGAGGNVVNHWQSPRSHFQVRMTESLLVRKDGSYIENVGTKPDVELVVNTDAEFRYGNIVNGAFEKAASLAAKKRYEGAELVLILAKKNKRVTEMDVRKL